MIKVNLLQNQSEAVEGATEFDIHDDFGTGGGGSQTEIAIKVVLMLIPSVILGIWGSIHVGDLEEKLSDLNKKISTITQQVVKNKKIADEVKGQQKEVLELESKINIIRDLSKVRLRELKAFDTLQNIIPEKVWLRNLKYQERLLTLEGSSLTDESLNAFVEALESRSYFTNVILLKAVEQKTKIGAVKVFTINSALSEAE